MSCIFCSSQESKDVYICSVCVQIFLGIGMKKAQEALEAVKEKGQKERAELLQSLIDGLNQPEPERKKKKVSIKLKNENPTFERFKKRMLAGNSP